MLKMLIWI